MASDALLFSSIRMTSESVKFDAQIVVRIGIRRHELNRIHKGCF